MAYAIVGVIIMLALLDRVTRLGRIEAAQLKTEYKIYALRDRLRMSAIQGKIEQDQRFELMDRGLTRTVTRLDGVNLWEYLALVHTYRSQQSEIDGVLNELDAAFESNSEIAEVYREYAVCLVNLLVTRHRVIFFVLKGLARTVGRLADYRSFEVKAPRAYLSANASMLLHQSPQPI